MREHRAGIGRRSSTRAGRLVLLACAAAALVGGLATARADDAVRAGASPTRGIDPRSGGFEVSLGEWAISPEAKAIRPGRVTFVIRNRGTVRHGLELEIRRVDERRHDDEHDDRDWDDDAKSLRLEPGGTTRMTLDLLPGVYEIECFVSHHDERGMRGVLEVRADAPLVQPAAVGRATVAISGFAFKPATLRTTVGATVAWRNGDAAPHTATGAGFSSPQLGKGGTYRRKFTRAGTYSYICAVHPSMRGKVVVAARSAR
jgi:plastocyanin